MATVILVTHLAAPFLFLEMVIPLPLGALTTTMTMELKLDTSESINMTLMKVFGRPSESRYWEKQEEIILALPFPSLMTEGRLPLVAEIIEWVA
eukprot:scaffold24556_cov343-Cylindrotheca_fusiformis.AAC.1